MKIAILSDTHNNWDNLSLAIQMANHEECDSLLFAGDLTVPAGIERMAAFNGSVHMVRGNMDKNISEIKEEAEKEGNVSYHGETFEDTLGDTHIFMSHRPQPAEEAAETNEYDLCVHGHTHEHREEKRNDTFLVNPGALQGPRGSANVGFMVYNEKRKAVDEIGLAY